MAIVAEQLVDEDVLVDSPDGSSITHVFRLHDDAGDELTRLDVYTWVDANYPRGTPLTDFPNLKVFSREMARLNNDRGFIWIVKVMYRTLSTGGLSSVPWNDAPKWRWMANAFDVPMSIDATTPTAKVVMNTAGDPFENPPSELRVYGELRYSRNVDPNSNLYDLIRTQMIEQNEDVVYGNSDQFTIMRIGGGNGLIVPARRAAMWIEGCEPDVRDGVAFASVNFAFRFYTIEYVDEVKIYSFGYNFLDPSDANKKKAIQYNGEPPRLPIPLDASGNKIDTVTSTSIPFLHTFKRRVSLVSFSPYGFI